MEKIKFMTDSASDIPDEYLEKYNITMLSVPVTIDGEGFYERKSFTIEEFYGYLNNSKEIPKTSRISEAECLEVFQKAYAEGYTHVIDMTINAGGSGTNMSAQMAKKVFFEETPDAMGKMEIIIVDSKTYSIAYGYAIIQSAKMAEEGKLAAEIVSYMEEWADCVEAHLGCYSLKHAKKSGRINATTAFVGDVLGMRPIVEMIDGGTEIPIKVRGDKNVVPKVMEQYLTRRSSEYAEALIIAGENYSEAEELQKLVEKETGQKLEIYRAGASILINAGPQIVAIAFRGKNRKK